MNLEKCLAAMSSHKSIVVKPYYWLLVVLAIPAGLSLLSSISSFYP
jgi:hypothetical protein